MASGVDQSLIYKRFEIKESASKYPAYSFSNPRYVANGHLLVNEGLVGFCNKTYPFIKMVGHPAHRDVDLNKNPPQKVCYCIEDVDSFIKEQLSKKEIEAYFSKPPSGRKYSYESRKYSQKPINGHTRKVFLDFFDPPQKPWSNLKDIFDQTDRPIFVLEYDPQSEEQWNRTSIIFNARLNGYEFFRVFDPYSAYQEITMFLGNLAEPRKDIPVPSDKDMVSIKGFDKYSFRKDPSKKKKH